MQRLHQTKTKQPADLTDFCVVFPFWGSALTAVALKEEKSIRG
jgi:hypothetical protein